MSPLGADRSWREGSSLVELGVGLGPLGPATGRASPRLRQDRGCLNGAFPGQPVLVWSPLRTGQGFECHREEVGI